MITNRNMENVRRAVVSHRAQWGVALLLMMTLVVLWMVYRPGMTGGFILDDYNNIVKNTHLPILEFTWDNLRQSALSGDSGPLKRPVSMLSFGLNIYANGLSPYYFKLTNLLIHVLNGIGIFFLTMLLAEAYRKNNSFQTAGPTTIWLALAVAAAWLVHPLNLTSVLYIVQRMTSLSALFCIWGLAAYVTGRLRLREGRAGLAWLLSSFLIFLPLAALSKENGVLLIPLMLVVEFSLFRLSAESLVTRRIVLGLFLLSLALPLTYGLIRVALDPQWILAGYATRGFTIGERLMTESRVIWGYIQQIIIPSAAKFGIYQDDIPLSRSLIQPVTTLFSIVGIAALTVVAFMARRKAPFITLGVLFFLVGHSIESTVIALEITFEHRNYLPMYGLLLILFFYGLHPGRYLRLRQMAAVLLILLLAFGTYIRAHDWSNPFDLVKSEVTHHPESVRANTDMADIYDRIEAKTPEGRERNYQLARYYYQKSVELDPNNTYGLVSLIILCATNGKAIEPAWLDELERRLESAPLPPVIGSRLVTLIRCQDAGTCKLPRQKLESILQAPLHNPTLTGLNRGEVRYAWAVYLINVAHDYATARQVMYEMAEKSGNLVHRMSLIKLLIALDDFEAAKAQLIRMKNSDKLHLYAAEISNQEKRLSEIAQ